MSQLTATGAMLSHPGRVRTNNEDSIACVLPAAATATPAPELIAIVADGMGGHAAGELASRIAVNTIVPVIQDSVLPPPETLATAIAQANAAIRARAAADPASAGMGTTCTVLLLRAGLLYLAHIGDSRAYLLRDGVLGQLTDDHSAVAQLVRDGALTQAEARLSPLRNIIQRALGAQAEAEPQVWPQGRAMAEGDRLLLCSDGLYDVVGEDDITKALATQAPEEACQALLAAALDAGAPDNVSLGVFHLCRRPEIAADDASTVPLPGPPANARDSTPPGSALA